MYLSHFPFQPRCAILSSLESCQLLNMILENSSFVSFILAKQLLFFFYDNFPSGSEGKESSCNVETQVRSLGWEDAPWRREWQPTPAFLPGIPLMEEPGGLRSMGLRSSEWLVLSLFTVRLMPVLLFSWRRWCWWNHRREPLCGTAGVWYGQLVSWEQWSCVAPSFLQPQSPVSLHSYWHIPSQASLFHSWIIATVGPHASELFSFSFLLCDTIRFIFLKHPFSRIIPLLANL